MCVCLCVVCGLAHWGLIKRALGLELGVCENDQEKLSDRLHL